MDRVMQLFLYFTGKSYSFTYKVLSLIPGTIVFLGITPFVLFHVSRYLSSLIPFSFPVSYEHAVAAIALFSSIFLMNSSMLILWVDGKGTPAPITPTQKLVTSGPYRYCRNLIELGTGGYFLFIGIWFDGMITGLLCQLFGMIFGYGYIKLIEERELLLQQLGILSKMDPETIVMMTKGSTGNNGEWLQATEIKAIRLDACYQAYAKGSDAYAEFIKGVRELS